MNLRLILLMGLCLWIARPSLATPVPTSGPSLPNLYTLEGQLTPVSPRKPKTLVYFWGTWCGHCKDKLRGILTELNHRPDLTVISVNLDEDPERARHYIKKNDIKLPVYRDVSKTLRQQFQITAVPYWALFENTGTEWKLKASRSAFHLPQVMSALSSSP